MKGLCLLILVVTVRGYWPWGSVPSCPDGPQPSCPAPDMYYRHPTDCNYFIQCDAGLQPICKQCPASLYFNLDTDTCDWPSHVACGDNGQPPPVEDNGQEPPVFTPSPIPVDGLGSGSDVSNCVVMPPNQDCPPAFSSDISDTFLPHPTDPACYFACHDGTAYLRHCPGSLVFNNAMQSCG